jgi:hypothetical protein
MISSYNYALSILQSSEIKPLPSSHGKLARAVALAADSPLQEVGFSHLFFIFVFAVTKQSGHANLQISTAEAIRIVCDSAAAVSPQTLPTKTKLHAQVGPFYQSSELFSGSTRVSHSKITCLVPADALVFLCG